MKFIYSLLVLLCFCSNSHGQSYTLSGTVMDTLNMQALRRASVTLIRPSDSVIVAHGRTGVDGRFDIKVAKEGKYLVRVTFVSFADFIDQVNISKPSTDLGQIPLVSKEHLLTEFVLTQQVSAIKIKGDTTEYMADSFKVKEGSNVEELLRRLPGITVDRNGKITAQGEVVQKVLVDGEEFFSDDPKVVTQGLQAGVVQKVQVYDKKSDQALFTGIDDGEKTKTINLEIKESKKKGFFGKLDAGAATNGYYQNSAMINAFKGKRQISAFGIASNTDKVGLDWADNNKFGSGSIGIDMGDDGYYMMSNGASDNFSGWNGTFSGQGLPKILTGGIHFSDKWNEEKDHFSGSYRGANQNVNIHGDFITQNTVAGDTSRINSEHKDQSSRVERHGFSGYYEKKIDSNSTVKLSVDGGYKNTLVSSMFHTVTYNLAAEAGPKTISDRSVTSNTYNTFLNADLLYRKKFKKKGRTFSLTMRENYTDTKGTGYLNSTISKPNNSGDFDTTRIDQKKTDTSITISLLAKGTYTEPISKRTFLEAEYTLTVNNSASKAFSLSKDSTNLYEVVDGAFSSDYKFNILKNQGGINFKYDFKKINFSFGTSVSNTNYLQSKLRLASATGEDSNLTYSYRNIFPKANFNYKMSKQANLSLSYEGSTRQPTISQIQPLHQNTDPLNITIGNPDLKQQFTNRVRLNYRNNKVLSHRYFYVGLSASNDINAISSSQTISGPYYTTRYINVNGNYSGYWWSGYSFKINKPDLDVRLSVDGNNSHYNNFINDHKNTSDNSSYSFGTDFSKSKQDHYRFSISPKITYNNNNSSISTYSTNYLELNTEISADIQLPKDISITSVLNSMIRQKTTAFPTNNDIIKWNASVSKKMLQKKLEAKATLYDILNQNTGFSRSAYGSTITQSNYNTIRRYLMFSLAWNFNYTPGNTKAKDDTQLKVIKN